MITDLRAPFPGILKDDGADPIFRAGDRVTISMRFPVGHYRVPQYIRGKKALVEDVLAPPAVDNEEEGYGRNAGLKRHYYRVSISLAELWPGYTGSHNDALRIEVYENWLERSE
jgi:nitrile hydratase subunit beta